MKIKLLYIISSFMKCGPINMFYTLVENLDFNRFEVHVVTLKTEPENTRIQDFLDLGVTVHQVSSKSSHLLFGLGPAVQGVVNTVKPDIVHSHGPWADYYAAKQTSYITVANIHNKLAGDYIPLYGYLIGSLTTKMDARSMRSMTKCVSVSRSVAETAKNEYGISSDVIINGIDTKKFSHPNTKDKLELRKKLKLPQDDYIFVHLGNLIDRKQPILLERAFLAIDSDMSKNAAIVFLGDGPLMAECIKAAEDDPRIILRGNIDNVSDYLQAVDCMVSATLSDGMSMATLEGLSCGLPCVMSDIDVHREIFDTFITTDEDFDIVANKKGNFTTAFEDKLKQGFRINDLDPSCLSGKRMSQEYMRMYEKLCAQCRN